MKQLTEDQLRKILVEAYEQGYEQATQDGLADYVKDDDQRTDFINDVIDSI